MRFFKGRKKKQVKKPKKYQMDASNDKGSVNAFDNTSPDSASVSSIAKKLRITLLFVFFSPLVFALIFNFIQVLGVSSNAYVCELTQSDYLIFIALQSAKNAAAAFMPFSLWSMLNLIIMQIVAVILLIYEIRVMIANRKEKTKESLLKRHKWAVFNFFSGLLLLFVISDHYISITRPQAIERTKFLSSVASNREIFFANCDATGDIQIGNTSQLIKKD